MLRNQVLVHILSYSPTSTLILTFRQDGGPKNLQVTKFAAGDYVLLTYPNRPPNKLAGMYRSPMVITSMDRPDLVKVRDLITNKAKCPTP